MTKTIAAGALLTLSVATFAFAQKKQASPPAQTSATFGGKAVKIDYSAPSVRGRKIFGDLVPLGKVWRTGANASTTLTTDVNLEMKGLKIPKGKYSLYSVPRDGGFTLIVNKQTGQWGTDFDATQDLGRVELDAGKADASVETMVITLKAAGDAKGTLTIAWDKLTASAPFTAQ
ncbi:MAG TPA: DUF2911 domain-containing protein [Myxococcales bacterium]|nr:DUF2911 domain-containing protein [Myxococcales bacterium]